MGKHSFRVTFIMSALHQSCAHKYRHNRESIFLYRSWQTTRVRHLVYIIKLIKTQPHLLIYQLSITAVML